MANQITVNSGTGNITVTTSRSVIGTVANVATANYANFAGNANVANTAATVTTNAQPNITSVGTLTGLTVNGTTTTTDLVVTGNLSVGNLVANTANYANFAGEANIANSATVANTANSVAVANVSGIGNIATVNLDGNAGNILYGNGVFAASPNVALVGDGGNLSNIQGANVSGAVANATYANTAGTANSVDGANVSGTVANATYANISGVAYSVSGSNVSGAVANATYADNAGNANTANSATVAASANSVAVANVSGIGNIATVNLDGNASNILYGNGAFAAPAVISNVANANYANFAGDVVNATQSNITSVGNLVSLTVNNGIANTPTYQFNGNGIPDGLGGNTPLRMSSGDGFLTTAYDVYNYDPSNVGAIFNTQYTATDANGTYDGVLVSTQSYGTPGTNNVPSLYAVRVFEPTSDLNNPSTGTGSSFQVGAGGLIVLTGSQVNTPSMGVFLYGNSTQNQASGIRFNRRRGNADSRAPVQASDYLGNVEWRASGANNGSLNSRIVTFGPKVDSSYGGPGNVMPIGFEMDVVDSSNNFIAHNFYANGTVAFGGNIVANNLGNIASINLDGSSSNVLYGNGVFAPAGGSGANANYANFAGDVVNSTQSNITVLGNLVSLQIGNNAANTTTTELIPVGANIATLSGNVFVNNVRTSNDDGDKLATTDGKTNDAVVLQFDTANGIGQFYDVNYLARDIANTSNIASAVTQEVQLLSYNPGDAAAASSYNVYVYTSDSDLANANPNTTLDVNYGGTGLFINQKMPNQNNGVFGAGIIGMLNYGEASDPSSATGLRFQRRRGNNSGGTTTRAPLQANDYLSNIAWRGAGANNGSVNSGTVTFGAKVDSSYGGPGNVMPIGMEMTVINSSNSAISHSFYANGDVNLNGNVFATNIGNVAAANFDGNGSNVLLGNGVFGSAPASTPTSIQNGNSKVDFTGPGGDLLIDIDGRQFAQFNYGRQLVLTGVSGDFANASQIKLDNGGMQIINEDLLGGLPSFEFKSYYTTGGTIAPYVFQRARGTFASPANAQSGDAIINQSFQAYSGSGFVQAGTFSATVANNDDAGNVQTRIEISTANNNDSSEIKLNTDIVNVAANTVIYLNANDSNVSGNLNVTGNINYTKTFGQFSSNVTQTNGNIGNAIIASFNTDEGSNGVSIVSNTQITTARTGYYNIQFSAQVEKTDSGTDNIEVWLKKNGTNVARSAGDVELQGNGAKAIVGWNWVVDSANVNDYYEIAWASNDANVQITAIDGANTLSGVDIPSWIVTVTPVGA